MDIRHGARMLAKNPGSSRSPRGPLPQPSEPAANVAMFSASDALLLRPLPVPHPREIMSLGVEYHNAYSSVLRTSYPEFLDLRDQAQSFEHLFAYGFLTAGIAGKSGDAARVKQGAAVTANLFQALGVEPQLGRAFRPEENQVPARDSVTVLSYALWQELGGDPGYTWLGPCKSRGIPGSPLSALHPKSLTLDRDHFFQPSFYIRDDVAAHYRRPQNAGPPRLHRHACRRRRLRPASSAFTQAQSELDSIENQPGARVSGNQPRPPGLMPVRNRVSDRHAGQSGL